MGTTLIQRITTFLVLIFVPLRFYKYLSPLYVPEKYLNYTYEEYEEIYYSLYFKRYKYDNFMELVHYLKFFIDDYYMEYLGVSAKDYPGYSLEHIANDKKFFKWIKNHKDIYDDLYEDFIATE